MDSPNSSPRRARSIADIYEATQAMFMLELETFEEVRHEKKQIQAMEEEIKAIEKNKTWFLINLPAGKEAIGLKWIYKTKLNTDGSVLKYKAHLVAKGYAQVYRVDVPLL